MKKFMVVAMLAAVCAGCLAKVVYAENEPAGVAKAVVAIPTLDKDQQNQLDQVLKQGADKNSVNEADSKENDKDNDPGIINARTGEKIEGAWVNKCYTDTYDDDALGRLQLLLYSENRPDSVFYGINNIRTEFVDAAGNTVLVRNAINKHPGEQGTKMCCNGFEVIDKFELKFGQTYKLKFYDNSKPSTDENLLATYDLNVGRPIKSDVPAEYRFEVSSCLPACNVRKQNSEEKISDRLKYRLEKLSKGDKLPSGELKEDMLKVDCSCLSNDNNEDSVFKTVDSLIVDFVDKDGNIIFSEKTGPTKVDARLNVVKSKDFKIDAKPFGSWLKVNSIKFYDGADESRSNILANFNFDLNKTPHLFDAVAVYKTD